MLVELTGCAGTIMMIKHAVLDRTLGCRIECGRFSNNFNSVSKLEHNSVMMIDRSSLYDIACNLAY